MYISIRIFVSVENKLSHSEYQKKIIIINHISWYKQPSSLVTAPFRIHEHEGGINSFNAAMDCSLLTSWTKATVETMATARVIEKASSYCFTKIDTKADANNKPINGSLNWSKYFFHNGSSSSSSSSLKPCWDLRFDT